MSASQIPPALLPYLSGEKEDYSSLQGSILTISVIFTVLVVVTAGLRFWVRFQMLRAVGIDDGASPPLSCRLPLTFPKC